MSDPLWDEIRDPPFYDRQGEPIPLRRWTELFGDKDYQVLAQTDVGGYWISTVWLGIDHGFGHTERPLIFETMVFEAELSYKKPSGLFPKGYTYRRDFEQWRYATEEEALKGHEELCEQVRVMIAATEVEIEVE